MRVTKSQKDLKELLKDNKYLKGLRKRVFPQLQKLVLNNSGDPAEAKDLFQESMIILFRKANEDGFALTSTVETFVYAIAKRLWLYELRKRKPKAPLEVLSNDGEGNKIDQWIIKEEKNQLYLKHFNQLSEGCKELLELFFKGFKMEEIASQLSLSSAGYTRKKKHGCQERLLDSIKSDPIYRELSSE